MNNTDLYLEEVLGALQSAKTAGILLRPTTELVPSKVGDAARELLEQLSQAAFGRNIPETSIQVAEDIREILQHVAMCAEKPPSVTQLLRPSDN